ncbi:MAG: dihydropteroate synthase [Calothrix sp. FI2-JRJ7]|jgi:dihydropteroate synthase|nr:dihydropteroate synthase [Calothrix sp. FI2-JRJ7]
MSSQLHIRNHTFDWGAKTYIMGVLNVTPDSFSDGGEFNSVDAAVIQAQEMVSSGADIIDIGGQSTRPGAEQISLQEELNRVIPVISAIRAVTDQIISVDTTSSEVAKLAIEAGGDIINDISGGTYDPEIFKVAFSMQAPIILMHIRGTPATMQKLTNYDDVVGEIISFLNEKIEIAVNTGIKRNQIIIDPGIGFAKNYEQNLEIFHRLKELHQLDCPILIGPSRKSFIGRILNQPDPKGRLMGTAAACSAAISQGADIVRVHDVKEIRDVCLVTDALTRNT